MKNIEILKHKDYIAYLNYSAHGVTSGGFVKDVIAMSRKLKPFNDYFNTALS